MPPRSAAPAASSSWRRSCRRSRARASGRSRCDELVRRCRPPRSRGVRVHGRRCVEQRLHHPPCLLDSVLTREAGAVADAARRAAAPRTASAPPRPRSANSMSSWIAPAPSARCASSSSLIPVDGSSLTTSWFGSMLALERPEPEPGRMLEHEPQLRLRHRQALAGADEERHARTSASSRSRAAARRRSRSSSPARRRRSSDSRRTARGRSAPGRPP